MKLGWFAVSAAGCVFRVSDPDGGGMDEMSLSTNPSQLESGETALIDVDDGYDEAEFEEVWDVRPVGDFTVVEWQGHDGSLEVVVDIGPEARGEQVLAIEFSGGTSYASFDVY